MFQALLDYKERFGDCNVPKRWDEYSSLGQWCLSQRQARKNEGLSQERITQLDEVGFVWDPLESAWEEMFGGLLDYKKRFGDCNVPISWTENPQLGKWCSRQRGFFKTGRLTLDRIQRLERVGFAWDPLEATWEQRFQELVEYNECFGNCNVPTRWRENPALGNWCGAQKKLHNSGSLSAERTARLEEIGFVWGAAEAAWEDMFRELLDYKNRFGDCDVPRGWSENPALGEWCRTQRRAYSNSELSAEGIARLEEVGFVWSLYDRDWEEMFDQCEII